MRILLLLLLITSPLYLLSQPILKEYKGRYINGTTIPAEAEYTYYTGDDGEEVRQGNFKYQVRETEGSDKYSQAFRGKYYKGLKDGDWSYRISMRDYNDDKSPAYLTGNITLLARYQKGQAEGRWEYTYSMKERSEVVVGGSKKWGRYSPTRKITITVNFKAGMMVDSVRVTDTHGTSIFGIFDSQGFFHQDWIFLTDSTEEISVYDHGVLTRHTFRKLIAENFDTEEDFPANIRKLQQFKAAIPKGKTGLQSLPFSTDTTSLFDISNHPVRTLILERLYSDQDFLYRYVPGDLSFVFDENRKRFIIDMKGGYTVEFLVKLTPDEETRLLRIKLLRSDISDIKTRTDIVVRGKTLPGNLKNAADLISHHAKLAEGFACLAQNIAQSETVKEGKSDAGACKLFSATSAHVGDGISKTAAFDAIIVQMNQLKETSQKYYDQIRKN